nr:MAG TPA: hypothetical protein [Inoviridae sp.]
MLTSIAHIIVPLIREQGFIDMLIQYMGVILGVIFLFFVLKH